MNMINKVLNSGPYFGYEMRVPCFLIRSIFSSTFQHKSLGFKSPRRGLVLDRKSCHRGYRVMEKGSRQTKVKMEMGGSEMCVWGGSKTLVFLPMYIHNVSSKITI